MLRIYFGELKSEIRGIDDVFDLEFEEEWLDDPFVQEMLKDIDNVTVQPNGQLTHPIFGRIRLDILSTGVKNLILAYKLNRAINASQCGDNCAKWLLKIAEKKDLHISLRHIMDFSRKDPDTPFRCYITNNHKQVSDLGTYAEEALKFVIERSNKDD